MNDISKQKIFTSAELAEVAQAAIDNWNWEINEEGGNEQFSLDMQTALKGMVDHPDRYCYEGFYTVQFLNIWDDLDEFARSTARNIEDARSRN